MTYTVYILTNYTNTVLYIGVTNNLARRIWEHRSKLVEGFTKRYNLTKLIYFEQTGDIKVAIAREKQLKAGPRHKKFELIEQQNPNLEDLYDSIIK